MKKQMLALVVGGALLAGTAGHTRAYPGDPVYPNPVVVVARGGSVGIPPNPIIPKLNHGAYVSAVAIPPNPVTPPVD